jgi:hypothetical protein
MFQVVAFYEISPPRFRMFMSPSLTIRSIHRNIDFTTLTTSREFYYIWTCFLRNNVHSHSIHAVSIGSKRLPEELACSQTVRFALHTTTLFWKHAVRPRYSVTITQNTTGRLFCCLAVSRHLHRPFDNLVIRPTAKSGYIQAVSKPVHCDLAVRGPLTESSGFTSRSVILFRGFSVIFHDRSRQILEHYHFLRTFFPTHGHHPSQWHIFK